MTLFAFYYVGIGAAVFLLGYFQVALKMSLFSYKERQSKIRLVSEILGFHLNLISTTQFDHIQL